jgi:hypothetical protein
MAVAGIDVAPGVYDRDDGLSGVVGLRAAHGSGARTVTEGAEIVGAIPTIASQ